MSKTRHPYIGARGLTHVLGLAGADDVAPLAAAIQSLRVEGAALRKRMTALEGECRAATTEAASAQAELARLRAAPLVYTVQVLSFHSSARSRSLAMPDPFDLTRRQHHRHGPFDQPRIATVCRIPALTVGSTTNFEVLSAAVQQVEQEGQWVPEDDDRPPTFVWSLLSRPKDALDFRTWSYVASTQGHLTKTNDQVALDDGRTELFLYLMPWQ